MTRDDIIRMARESADQSPREDWNTNAWVFGEEALERFFHAAYAAGAAAEREACAKVCEEFEFEFADDSAGTLIDVAKAIRARGGEMTRDDIIELANKAADQAPREDWNTNVWVFGAEMLEYFAELVAAAEREACAQVCEQFEEDMGHGIPQRCADAIRARGEK